MPQGKVRDLLDRHRALATNRTTWEQHWQELAEYLLPARAEFGRRPVPGAKRTEKQFDGTPMLAVRGLAAAVDAMLKGRSSRWFRLKVGDPDLEIDEVRAWLQAAEDRLYDAIYHADAKFAERTAEVDLDLVTFGTGVLFLGERVGRGLLFKSFHLRDTCVAENADGDIDTVFRTFRMTVRQAAQAFGREALGSKAKEALEKRDLEHEIELLHACFPREDREPGRADARHMPWASLYVDVASEHLIGESGFHEFPYMVPRWETATSEVYGRSPGMLALPDVKTLNEISKTLLKAGQKAVDPPMLAPDEGVTSAIRTFPGGVTYYEASRFLQAGRPPIEPLITGANIPLGMEMQNQARDQIWSAFFRNVLQLPVDAPNMTATEVIERREEFMRVIGPTFGRLQSSYVGPLVERAFNILLRADALPEPPEVLRGRNVKIDYESPVAKAQKQMEIVAAARTAEILAPYVGADPTIMDVFDGERMAREIGEIAGMPHGWLKSPDRIARERNQRAMSMAASALGASPDAGVSAPAMPALAALGLGGTR